MPIIGLWVVPLAIATSFLWALTGSASKYNYKLWRRLLVPALACLAVYLVTHNWHIWLSLPLAFGILSIGYGIPDSTDEGSALGKFWYKVSEQYANILTRSSIYILLALSFLIGLI
jgi:hypothetical protein